MVSPIAVSFSGKPEGRIPRISVVSYAELPEMPTSAEPGFPARALTRLAENDSAGAALSNVVIGRD